ncbi:MAG TPA: hypothetical protein PLN06_02840 [Bacteroidales bacterium]|nr:hypothetical protein [Bacteroidales bacterium]HCI55049.1 hypothetical protein [Bacteroidales bacterium]HOU95545.1 hypothetical protein [Bacteroidales bacterium]HQG36166.1 hypothetical protein [Bacteroidales bacterium]HQG53384.1 hypothetical protein [Bacteroidales bacterium]
MKNKGEILAEILSEFDDCYFFLHNTREQNIAEKIMKEGFRYESQLPHSTDRVNPKEPIEITYFLFQRKEYGIYTIVIAIPKETYERYIRLSDLLDIPVEEVMSTEKPWLNDNDEIVYTLSAKHILGYFNNKTSEFLMNPLWDPYFDSTENKIFKRRPPADIIPK